MKKPLSISENHRRTVWACTFAIIAVVAGIWLSSTVPSSLSYASNLSPLSASDYLFVGKWGTTGAGTGEFTAPRQVALDRTNGWLYVADELNNRIQKFDTNGTFLKQWGVAKPYGVAVSANGIVYISSQKRNNIVKFDNLGNKLGQFGSKGSGNGQFLQPLGLAVDKNGNVYVADYKNNRVQKFKADGTYLTQWKTVANANDKLAYPYGVAVDAQLNVFIADTSHHRIVKFNKKGKYVKKWGKEGGGNGQFEYPRTMAVDSSGNVYVADAQNNRVQKFDVNGNFLTVIGSVGGGDGQFNTPHGVAVEADGAHLYVADTYNNRIEKLVRGDLVTNTPTATATITITPTPTRTNTPSPTPTFTMFGNGSDGDLVVTNDFTFDPARAQVSGTQGNTVLSFSQISGTFQANQKVLIHQSQGTNAGAWELNTIQSTGVGLITLQSPLANTYFTDGGNNIAQMIWVPQYHNVTINSGVTFQSIQWNGGGGGMIALLSNGTTTISGTISVIGKGFRGGGGTTGGGGYQGEGTPGIGQRPYNSSANGNGGGAGPVHGGGGVMELPVRLCRGWVVPLAETPS